MATTNYTPGNFAWILAEYDGNQSQTARRLGVHRNSVCKALAMRSQLQGVTPVPIKRAAPVTQSNEKRPQPISGSFAQPTAEGLSQSSILNNPEVIAALLRAVGIEVPAVFEPQPEPSPVPSAEPAKIIIPEPRKEAGKRTFVLVCWEARVKPEPGFLACLQQLIRERQAQAFVTFTHPEDYELLPDSLRHFTPLLGDLRFNDNCWFRYRRTNALNTEVTTQYRGVFEETAIIPALGKELVTLPIPAKATSAKQVITVPSVGRLDASLTDYANASENAEKILRARFAQIQHRSMGARYHIAQQRVIPAALIVEVLDDKRFFTRYVTYKSDGALYDLDRKFTADGVEHSRPAALMIGDIHDWEKDPDAIAVVKEQSEVLRPRIGILNDFFDGRSCSHHDWHDPVHWAKAPTLGQERDQAAAFLRELSGWFDSIAYLESNHDRFVLDYVLNPQKWRPQDHQLCSELMVYRHKTNRHPIIELLGLDEVANLQFIPDSESFMVGSTACRHGHIGVSGARPNFIALAKALKDYSQGHTHSPRVWYEADCCGLNERLDVPYRKNVSGWWFSNILHQPDSSKQLLPSVGREWRGR